MNRQIKFRGKDRKTGKWVYGDLLTPITGCRIVNYTEEDNGAMKRADYNYHDIHDDTVGQFTGLLDRNGKEIYEGDILAYKWMDGDIAEVDYYSVHFIEGAFCLKGEYSITPLYEQDMSEYEVVGNIHEQSKS